jgi:23S rRNA pseudouridine1911/1915/1917 synthase
VPFVVKQLLVASENPLIGQRIDRCVQQMTGESRSWVTGLFDHDCVTLNGTLETNPGRSLTEGDSVQIRFEANRRYSPRRRPSEAKHRGFSILFEDKDVLVVDKSAELLTVPTDAGEPHTLISRISEHVRKTSRASGAHLVHRLDRGVSGLLVFGKSQSAADALQNQFSRRKPERRYDALVSGIMEQDSGTFRSFLATGRNLSRYSTRDAEAGELAITHFEVVSRLSETGRSSAVTHVRVQLETGRRNQIRVHMSEAGHAILGDSRYRPELWASIPWHVKRLALHASVLGFVHPRTDEQLSFQSPMPDEIVKFLRYIRAPR